MKNHNVDDQDLNVFFDHFGIKVEDDIDFPVWESVNTTSTISYERGYRLTISESELMHLLSILKTKGFFHDEDYMNRIKESRIIVTNPQLKKLYDQYKTMLYMLIDYNE